MNKVKATFVVLVVLGLLGCATVPAPKPIDPERSVIGITVATGSPMLKFLTDKAEMVYFIKVDEEEDLYNQENFIRSNYTKGGQVYLLNAKPGRYAAIACYEKKKSQLMVGEFTTLFPKELIKLTEVSVAPGTIAFMGEYVVDMSVGLKGADDSQLHYIQVIEPGANVDVLTMTLTPVLTRHGDYFYKGTLREKDRGKDAEKKFLTSASEQFQGSGWINPIQKRMKELKEGIEMPAHDIGKEIKQKTKESDKPIEEQILASIPKDMPIARVSLRKKPMKISTAEKINTMLAEYGFCDTSRNILGSFNNDFIDNNDGTVTDKATGLMWQKNGSSKSLENMGAKRYIKRLNKDRFAGHSNWRLPTVEELASLLTESKKNGVHIDPVFDNKQTTCWTIDQCDAGYYTHSGAWIVDFKQGTIDRATYSDSSLSHHAWYATKDINYVKAVRSVKE